jgi:hypothetical protein
VTPGLHAGMRDASVRGFRDTTSGNPWKMSSANRSGYPYPRAAVPPVRSSRQRRGPVPQRTGPAVVCKGAAMEGFLGIAGSFVILVLVILGIGGTMYHAIGSDGLVVTLFSRLLSQNFVIALVGFVALGLAFWLGRRWLRDTQANRLFNDGLMYAVAALGFVYAVRLWFFGYV